jgi:alpha-1,2-glucosyltransferase
MRCAAGTASAAHLTLPCAPHSVVGDRDNHRPVLHLAQPLYLLAVCGAFVLGPLEAARAAARALRRVDRLPAAGAAAAGAAALAAVAGAVHLGSLDHPFLLSDNRHFTFYVWRRLTPPLRLALSPVYVAAGAMLYAHLRRSGATRLWIAALALCSAAVLVPAHLLEPRYFTVPVLLAMLSARPSSSASYACLLAASAAINATVLYLFLARPFRWADGSVARFMW